MNFFIQVSNPKYLINTNNTYDVCLSEAIEGICPLNTENAFLSWNHIYVPLSYKYDISYMVDDVVKLLHEIQGSKTGSLIIHWLPDTFRCDWQTEWSQDVIKIASHWDCTVGHLEGLLNNNNTISIPIVQFLNEWKELLGILVEGLEVNGYNEVNLTSMKELISIYEDGTGIYI